MSGPDGALGLLNRYQSRLQRDYQRLLKTLTDLQAARRATEAQSAAQPKVQNEPKPASYNSAPTPPIPPVPRAEPHVHETPDAAALSSNSISPSAW